MGNFYGQYLDTIGIEYESTSMYQQKIKNVLAEYFNPIAGELAKCINITRDASTEFLAENIRASNGQYLLVSSHTPCAKRLYGAGGNTVTMGFELYSSPIEIKKFDRVVYPLMQVLRNNGDFTSKRASIHFHVGFVNNLRLLKNILRVSLMLEPVLYRLGGMGDVFRGESNLSAYARPLLNSAAVEISRGLTIRDLNRIREEENEIEMNEENELEDATKNKTKKQLVRIINPRAALDAEYIEQFWASFGVDYTGANNKYLPSRYSGTNFFAMYSHGTIEFRHTNQSLDAPLIVSIGKFLRGIVEMSTLLSKNEIHQFDIINSNEEISVADSRDIVARIMAICYDKGIENIPTDNEISLILETIEKSSFKSIPETPVKTHIQQFYLPEKIASLGNLLSVSDYLNPQHTDIHNISKKVVSIFS
jgi:hypothetical protein